ncbi:hypothetical protein NQ314_010014 [Rhamnusium bicolor]|uniref:Trehalose 6-phosphate phosphatase n=1 Tax=Rhamnusium bicolor TaxID=1586634 RepID=A0AAV8XUE6_9CUCU|nr:hypothetical protein NQ314_010014 [Rhamnusium bicolor]
MSSTSSNCEFLSPTFDCYEEYLKTYLRSSAKLAILLDYDGIFLAIISGRNVNNVKEIVGIEKITYAGNHGLEVLYPDGTTYVHQLPAEFNDQVKEVINKLKGTVVRDGAWIEDKGASLTFHFRAVPENLRNEIEQTAHKIIEDANFKVGKAHCALEARPKVEWNKGKVALLILNKEFGEKWSENVKVIFAGDDTTDEDAMQALKGNAATFRIAPSVDIETHAVKLLSSTEAALNMLKFVEKIFRKC